MRTSTTHLASFLVILGVLHVILATIFRIHPIASEESEIINAVFILCILLIVTFVRRLPNICRYFLVFGMALYDTVQLAMQNFWIESTINRPEFEAVLGSEELDFGSTPLFIYNTVFWAISAFVATCIIKGKAGRSAGLSRQDVGSESLLQ